MKKLALRLKGILQCFNMGAVSIIGLPGEVMAEIGLKIKKKKGNTMVAGYSNGSIGYIPTRKSLNEGGYETLSYIHQGYPAPYASGMEAKLLRKINDFLK